MDRLVLVEIKSVEQLAAIQGAQMWTYLKLAGRRVGLVINFNVKYLRDGVRRVVGPTSEL